MSPEKIESFFISEDRNRLRTLEVGETLELIELHKLLNRVLVFRECTKNEFQEAVLEPADRNDASGAEYR